MMRRMAIRRFQANIATICVAALLALGTVVASGSVAFGAPAGRITVYSGRSQALVAPIIEAFTKETGIEVAVRYGDTAALAATILEEGNNSPADVYWAQDAGALGALAKAGRLEKLPDEILNLTEERLRSPEGVWVPTSGRARVVAYNTSVLSEADLPDTIWGFTDPKWSGRIGWAPTNASFQAFVTAIRVLEGEERAAEWLRGIQANRPRVYSNNSVAVDAVSRREVDVAFVNHYYLYQFLSERGDAFPVRNYYTKGDPGAMINVAGLGILKTSKNKDAAQLFVEFMLSREAQQYFARQTHEYPVIDDPSIEIDPRLLPLEAIEAPDIDLSDLDDLEGTLELLQRVGVL